MLEPWDTENCWDASVIIIGMSRQVEASSYGDEVWGTCHMSGHSGESELSLEVML